MATLTSAQLDTIAACIFILRDRKDTRLKKPVTFQTLAFELAMDPIAADPDFKDVGIGIIDFTGNKTSPNVRLISGDKAFRCGSTTKIAMMLTAVQLRTDIRNILALSPQIVTTAAEFDALYANAALWRKGKAPRSNKGDRIAAVPPLISKIFDFTKSPVDFAGPDVDTQHLPANHDKAFDKLHGESAWDSDPPLSFAEHFWMTGLMSDNVAATTCISKIGVPYLKAVMRAYGLFDHPDLGMHLLTTAEYDTIPPKKKKSTDPDPPRKLTDPEHPDVEDKWLGGSGRYDDKRSWVPGSAAALTAYMIALINDGFAIPNTAGATGSAACTTIRNNLADGGNRSILSYVIGDSTNTNGIKKVARVTKQMNKIGLLQNSLGAEVDIVAEFVYVETLEKTTPPAGKRNAMQYAIVIAGMRSDATNDVEVKTNRLAETVHKALAKL